MFNKVSAISQVLKIIFKICIFSVLLFGLILSVIVLVNLLAPFNRNPFGFEILLTSMLFLMVVLLFFACYMLVKKNSNKAVEELKQRFISILNHKIRTKLTSISGPLTIISNGLVGEIPLRLKEMINMAHENAQDLSNEIDNLLDIDNYSKDA